MLKAIGASLICAATCNGAALAGPINPPPGPVSPTPGPEPRIAINATNTPGDANSLFKITQPGSYYLTGNVIGVAEKHGIEIAVSGVTIDLNGFSLVGAPSLGAFDGVTASVGFLTNITVKNGSVRNWREDGVDLSTFSSINCIIDSVSASLNGGNGVSVAFGSVIRSCSVYGNFGDGVVAQFGSVIEGCTAYANGGSGISTVQGSTIGTCSAFDNLGNGITAGVDSTVTGCTSSRNSGSGISAINGCTISGSTCAGNGEEGDGAGILISGTDNRIEGNNCITNDRGIDVNSAANIIIRNTCSGNAINWDIAANNIYGPIIDRTAPGSAAVSGNSAPDSTGSTHPNANFTY